MPGELSARLLSATFAIETTAGTAEWESRSSRGNATTRRFVLTDARSGLEVELDLALHELHGAATVSASLNNPTDENAPPITAIRPLVLRFSDALGAKVRTLGGGLTYGTYPPPSYAERTSVVRHAGEAIMIESGPDGRSSNRDLPFLMVEIGGAGLVTALEWSGLWRQKASYGPDLTLDAEVPVTDLVLSPGEVLRLPPAHAVFFEGGLDDGGNALRRYIYDLVTPDLGSKRPLPPVSYDHWFGVGCDYDLDFLKSQVDRCDNLGVEYFVLDAGWYAGCGPGGNFSSGVGNWTRVDLEKFPDGIDPLADYVRSSGMELGMWFEVERVHRQSDLAREHPEWCLDLGQDFLHLNLASQGAQDYVIGVVDGWIKRLDLRWTRWDYNIGPKPFWDRFDPSGKLMFHYVEGLYRVLDALMAANPGWLVECCSSGGRRIDLGTLHRSHTAWFSDHTDDPHICRFMQTGANHFLPGIYPNSAVPTDRGAGDHGLSDFDFVSRMCGSLSLDGDIASWSGGLTSRAGELVGIYKSLRHLLVGDFYPLATHPKRPDEWDAAEFASPNGSEAVLFAFRPDSPQKSKRLKMKGLAPAQTYEVKDPLDDREVEMLSGTALMHEGLRIALPRDSATIRMITTTRQRA
jgi:alpha-galactosidase